MTAIAEFELDPSVIPLGKLFERYPTARVELERVVPFQNRAISYLWVTNGDADVEDGFDPGGGIDGLQVVDAFGDRTLVRIEWSPDVTGLTRAIAVSDVSLLSALGTAGGWQFSVRGDDREAIARFHEECSADGVHVKLVSLHRLHEEYDAEGVHLSDAQREALVLAYDRGYYDSPRTATLSDLAASLGISRQAVAARLKRGTRNLVEDCIQRDGSAEQPQ